MAELKRGDVIRCKLTGETGIFYSDYKLLDNPQMAYVLLPNYETPQITTDINIYEPTGEHIDIFEKVKQGKPANEKVKMAQDLMNSMHNLFWSNDKKENKDMQNIDDYEEFMGERPSVGGHPYSEFEELDDMPEDDRVLIDVDDFIALAKSEASSKNTLNYILRALRLGVEPSVILAIFDENTGDSIEDLLMKPESPFYIPGNDEEIKK